MKKTNPPISVRAGNLEFRKLNAARWDKRDTYYWLLTLTWPRFALFLSSAYVGVNLLFALLFTLGGSEAIAEMRGGSFVDAFFFSVETLATIGYGHMYPVSFYGHLVVTAEVIVGMFGMAVVTGLIFVRFSRPTASLEFTRTIVVSEFDGVPALMVRVANQRHQPMVEAQFRMMMLLNEPVKEGDVARRFYELSLQVERIIMFPAALTIRHFVTERSPLFGLTKEDLEKGDARFMASVVCVDTIVAASVQSQQAYDIVDVRFGERFVEIYTEDAEGRLVVDYGRLHETEPVK